MPAWSCLDGLWEALQAGPLLRSQQPAVLAHALRALLTMWQVTQKTQPRKSQYHVCCSWLHFPSASAFTLLE